MQNDILPVILGASEGAYALARSFHHDYGIRPLVLDEAPSPLFLHSDAARFCSVAHLASPHILYRVLTDFYEEDKRKCYLLIPATSHYLACVREREAWLSTMFLMPHLPSLESGEVLRDPIAALFLYRSAEGDCILAYADVIAKTETQAPVTLLAAACPDEIEAAVLEAAKSLSRGCYLFYLDRDEEDGLSLVMAEEPLSPLMSLTLAHDISIPELFLREVVLCEPIEPPSGALYGAFSLFPYRKVKRLLSKEGKKECRRHAKCGNLISLYTLKNERFSFSLNRIFDSFCLKYGIKKRKIKK